tara:strand:- start:593 stop:985 length:393 start_codon:yes stop_codon:yes gene_type:complete
MADKRQYGWYIRGKDLALVEIDVELNASNPVDDATWKSPVKTIDDGIMLEYVVRPKAKDGGEIIDESDEPDIPDLYLKALVYYLKARIAEDQRDFEAKEYYMREFYKYLDKNENIGIPTVRIIHPTIAIR